MQTKLTLRLESQLIAHAKAYAEKTGKSLSQIVSDYFQLLHKKAPKKAGKPKTSPLTQKLRGVLKTSEIDEAAYKTYLSKKYQ